SLANLLELKNWLKQYQVNQIVLENTGVYHEPIVAVLKEDFEVFAVNAADTKRKNLKKTDKDDAWWLANLLRAGTIGRGKRIEVAVPLDTNRAELRKLTRMKSRYTNQATRHKNRVSKVFARLNVKIMDVFKDNKFTATALGVYEAVAQGFSWDDFLQSLSDQQALTKGKNRGIITRQIT
ncbi:MAG: IS110 family transposase, partial [Candidatus Diapherotrites archaeon]|nr:IS110 family transposase [Candidatus Diapherotrites archaeon]